MSSKHLNTLWAGSTLKAGDGTFLSGGTRGISLMRLFARNPKFYNTRVKSVRATESLIRATESL